MNMNAIVKSSGEYRIRPNELLFYAIFFYAFGLDYLYAAFPQLNLIFNSIVVGVVILSLIVVNLTLKYKRIPLSLIAIYAVSVFFVLFSLLIQSGQSFIWNEILTLHNIKLVVFIPLSLCVFSKYDLVRLMNKISIFMLLYYFVIYKFYFSITSYETDFYAEYGMGYGFANTLFWVIYLRYCFQKGKVIYYLFAAFDALLIISFAPRSVILIMGAASFANVFIYWGADSKKKKLAMTVLLIFVAVMVFVFQNLLIDILIYLLQGFSNMGRTLWFLQNRSATFNADGRDFIWAACIKAIREHPLYIRGACGDILYLHGAIGIDFYAHNLYLEILMQFGLVLGGIIILWLIKGLVFCFRMKDKEWQAIILPFGIMSFVSLFFSMSFWACSWFWMYIVLLMLYRKEMRTPYRYVV